MGWGSGTSTTGRDIGYCVDAVCDRPDCNAEIDRGLAYVCGGMHDARWGVGCGDYFCSDHLIYGVSTVDPETGEDLDDGPHAQLCEGCEATWQTEGMIPCEDCGHLGHRHDRRADPHKSDKPRPPCADCDCGGFELP